MGVGGGRQKSRHRALRLKSVRGERSAEEGGGTFEAEVTSCVTVLGGVLKTE